MYRVDPNKLAVVKAHLMIRKQRDISWSEFAEITGVLLNTLSNIRNGRSTGSAQTVQRITSAMIREGVSITHHDLITSPLELPTNVRVRTDIS